ncbi:MAG: phosphatase PAP2 family protein [Acidimicrobiales bacterium]
MTAVERGSSTRRPDESDSQAESTESEPATPGRGAGLRWWREVIYVVLVYVAYSAVRNQFGSGSGGPVLAEPAFNHGKAIIQLEQNIRLYFEQDLHEWYLGLPGHGLIRFWNVYYGLGHFVVTAVALIWIFRRVPARYRVWRNTLAITTMLALIGFASFSLMPPRLLDDPGIYGGCQVYAGTEGLPAEAGDPGCDEFGYVDTVAVYGGWASFGSEQMAKVSNQYAAMPSMHIGWSTWCAFVLFPMVRRRWAKVLVVAYPLVTLFDIIVTANHYWIDGIGGLACLGAGYVIARTATNWWETRRGIHLTVPSSA